MRRNRVGTAAVGCALLLSSLCACAVSPDQLPSPPPTVLPTPAPTPTHVSLDLLDPTNCEVHVWHALTGPAEAVLLELATTFEQTNAYGIKVRMEHHSPLDREVLAASDAGTPPDLLIAACDLIAELNGIEVAVPLQEYVTSAQFGLSEADLADLWPQVLEGGCLAVNGGQPLGLLVDSQMVAMFYNQALLKKLKVADPPQTWEQFREVCNAARDQKAGTWGLVLTAEGSTVVSWILGLGGQAFDLDTGEVTLDSPEGVAALSELGTLVRDGCAYYEEDAAVSQATFSAGHTLFTFGSTAALSEYSSVAKGVEPGLAPVPYLTERPTAHVQGSVASLLRTSPRQQLAAWLFLQWLAQPESDLRWVLATGALPMRRSTLNAEEIQAHLEQNPMYKTACDLLADAQTEPAAKNWGEILELLGHAARIVCEEQADPAEALAAAEMAVDSLANR